jgi:hypothetical protein
VWTLQLPSAAGAAQESYRKAAEQACSSFPNRAFIQQIPVSPHTRKQHERSA